MDEVREAEAIYNKALMQAGQDYYQATVKADELFDTYPKRADETYRQAKEAIEANHNKTLTQIAAKQRPGG